MKDSDSSDSPMKASTVKRAVSVGIAIINPFSDLKVIYNFGLKPLVLKLKDLRAFVQPRTGPVEALNFAQAVQRSGKTAAELTIVYRRKQLLWSAPMIGLGALSLILFSMILLATNLPTVTMIRASVSALVMAALAFYSYSRVLGAVYRHWQLLNQKVSISEGGTYSDFVREVNPVSDIIFLKYQTREWK